MIWITVLELLFCQKKDCIQLLKSQPTLNMLLLCQILKGTVDPLPEWGRSNISNRYWPPHLTHRTSRENQTDLFCGWDVVVNLHYFEMLLLPPGLNLILIGATLLFQTEPNRTYYVWCFIWFPQVLLWKKLLNILDLENSSSKSPSCPDLHGYVEVKIK